MSRTRVVFLWVLCGALFTAPSILLAHSPHRGPALHPPRTGTQETLAHLTIPDVVVLNQDGQRLRFYRDLIQGKVVAINFIYTTCTTVCPLLTATFARLQHLLGERLGTDYSLISVSVDPITDTPARLHAWGAKFRAKPGWTLVTGPKQTIDKLLKALRVFTPLIEDHAPIVLIGNDLRGAWTRTYGLTSPTQLQALLEDMHTMSASTRTVQEIRR